MTGLLGNIENNLPFITVLTYGQCEYVGIIINQDQHVTSFYDINVLRTIEERAIFLELGESWWYESSRKIPLTIFLKNEIQPFYYAIKTFSTKDVKITMGPVVNLTELALKRVKRRQVQLVKRIVPTK